MIDLDMLGTMIDGVVGHIDRVDIVVVDDRTKGN